MVLEGEGWLVVAKPPGLLVHKNPKAWGEPAALQRVRNQTGRHVYPIHRLDRPASGCLLFATEQELAGPLSMALGAPTAQKSYLVLVRGCTRMEGTVVVDNPMKDDLGIEKQARSRVRCLGTSMEPRCSLFLVEPDTGRFHQVRRHVRDLNHPVIGDTSHGDGKVNRWWREEQGVRRLMLHCHSIRLQVPDGPEIDATCPLFEDMAKVLQRMPWWEEAVAALPALGLPPLPLDPTAPGAPPPDAGELPEALEAMLLGD